MTILCHTLKLPAHGRHQVNAEHCRNRKKPDGPGSRVERQRDFFCAAGRERTRPEPSRRSESGPHRPRRCRPSCGRVRQARDWRAGRWRKQRGLKGTTGHGTCSARIVQRTWYRASARIGGCLAASTALRTRRRRGSKKSTRPQIEYRFTIYALHFTSLHAFTSLFHPTVRGASHACRPSHIGKGGGAGRVATI